MSIKLSVREKVTNLCLEAVLNCIKSNVVKGNKYPFNQISSKINDDVLLYYWALIDDIEELCKVIIENPRRLTMSIVFEEIESRGAITGSINAGASVLAQARTLDPTFFIVNEPSETFQSGPNYLVAWTLSVAQEILFSARTINKKLDNYEWFNNKISLLENALRNDILKNILLSSFSKGRPSAAVLRVASKSRTYVYQLAINIYNLLEKLEERDTEAIFECLTKTLVADLEYWQQLELGTGIMAAKSLSRILAEPIFLNYPFENGMPIAKVGPFNIYWQYTVPQRPLKKLDISEKWTREIAAEIGVKPTDSRADIGITFKNRIVSIFECKYFESTENVSQVVMEASSQIVRYARDINLDSINHAESFIRRSCIIVSNRNKFNPVILTHDSKGKVFFMDIDDIRKGSMDVWANELVSYCISNV